MVSCMGRLNWSGTDWVGHGRAGAPKRWMAAHVEWMGVVCGSIYTSHVWFHLGSKKWSSWKVNIGEDSNRLVDPP